MLHFVDIAGSPLAPGVAPVRLRYREAGAGRPLVLLHGGWGYQIYSFDRQIERLRDRYRVVAPDRTGYGGSGTLAAQEPDFHQRAAAETLALIDALGIDRALLWGHSDGAVIAFHVALAAPDRVEGIVAEAAHFWRRKPASREFFETMRDAPGTLGERVTAVLADDHGPRWDALIRANGDAWLRIAARGGDLYDGRLGEVGRPTLLVHGGHDPRTEPGELDALAAALARRPAILVLPEGGHSPHSERATADQVTDAVAEWLVRLKPDATGGGTGER